MSQAAGMPNVARNIAGLVPRPVSVALSVSLPEGGEQQDEDIDRSPVSGLVKVPEQPLASPY